MTTATRPLTMAIARATATTSGRVNAHTIVASRLDVFCRVLARVLGTPVASRIAEDYSELSAAVDSGEVDVAWLPPIVGYQLVRADRVVGMALPIRANGGAVSGALFTRDDGSIPDLAAAAGGSVAWVDRFSAAGYLVPRAALRIAGTPAERLFSSEQFLGSHGEVVRAVLTGDASVGASFVYRSPTGDVLRAGWGDARVRILLEHGPLPGDILAAAKRLSKQHLRQLELSMVMEPNSMLIAAACELFEAEGFMGVPHGHFSALEGLALHLDHEQSSPTSQRPSR